MIRVVVRMKNVDSTMNDETKRDAMCDQVNKMRNNNINVIKEYYSQRV
jgi:hypothetical protein